MCLLLEVEKETAVSETRKVPHFQEWSEACSRFSSRPRLLYLSLSLSVLNPEPQDLRQSWEKWSGWHVSYELSSVYKLSTVKWAVVQQQNIKCWRSSSTGDEGRSHTLFLLLHLQFFLGGGGGWVGREELQKKNSLRVSFYFAHVCFHWPWTQTYRFSTFISLRGVNHCHSFSSSILIFNLHSHSVTWGPYLKAKVVAGSGLYMSTQGRANRGLFKNWCILVK